MGGLGTDAGRAALARTGDVEDLDAVRQQPRTHRRGRGVAAQIDEEVRRIVTASLIRVRKLLGDNLDKLHIVAKALLENETLNREEFEEIFVAAPA